MATNLLSMNPYFQPGAPGEGAFGEALASYFDELRKSGTGAGLPALAGAKAAQGPGIAYQQAMAAPSALGDAFGNNSFAQLMAGQTGANQVANATKSQVQQHGERGVGDVANNYTTSLQNAAQGEMALNAAQANASAIDWGAIGQLLGGPFGKLIGAGFGGTGQQVPVASGPTFGGTQGGAFSSMGSNGTPATMNPDTFMSGTSPFSFFNDPGFAAGMGPFSMMGMGA